jgi:hypothetical protein
LSLFRENQTPKKTIPPMATSTIKMVISFIFTVMAMLFVCCVFTPFPRSAGTVFIYRSCLCFQANTNQPNAAARALQWVAEPTGSSGRFSTVAFAFEIYTYQSSQNKALAAFF